MIHVIATIEVHPGQRDTFIRQFEAMKPQVIAEDGCLEYGAAIALDTGLPAGGNYAWAGANGNAVFIIEKWSTMETWKAHLGAPHMDTYRARTKDLVARRSVQVLAPAERTNAL
jgi:quinol monooxygenase YgiN